MTFKRTYYFIKPDHNWTVYKKTLLHFYKDRAEIVVLSFLGNQRNMLAQGVDWGAQLAEV